MDPSDFPFLRGGGECGAVVRATDWASTPVGAVEDWPLSLRSLVAAVLNSRHPMLVWWGPELVQFYNDAYLPSFGAGKHPAAMGQAAAECWGEIWPVISPQIEDVMERGIASWNVDQLIPILRNGHLEDVYWTYGYSPAFGDEGSICGVLVVCTETTEAVVSRRRLHSLHHLASATALATDPTAVVRAAADGLTHSNPVDVPFALFYDASEPPSLIQASGLAPIQTALVDDRMRGRLRELADSSSPTRLEGLGSPASEVFVQTIAGQEEPVIGHLVVGLNPGLPFDAPYREYLSQITEHVRMAKARVRAFRTRAHVERERDHLLEQAPVALALLIGPQHHFRLANARYVEMVGREVVGKTYLEAFPELVGTALPGILDEVYATGEPFVVEELRIPLYGSGDGELEDRFFLFNLEPVRDPSGNVYGMMAVAVDITPQVVTRKRVEDGQIERERLVKDLEGAHRTKDEFLAMLGHELRNPLSPIVTALELMQLRGIEGADRERAIIERQVRHMVNLVDDLLDVSRITRGILELDRAHVGMHHVVARAIEQASPLIDRRRHRLEVNVPEDLFVTETSGVSHR